MSASAAECSSCVPCEKFRRNTSTPASINWRRTVGERDAGPIVATIFVRLGGRSVPRPFISGQLHRPELSGEGGIRTLDSLSAISVFETDAFNHSATSPETPILRVEHY